MNTCRETEDALVDLVDGRLGVAAEVRLHDHVERCDSCRARAAVWGRLVPAMRAVAPPRPDAMQLRRMEIGIDRQLHAEHREPARARRWWPVSVAAALGVVCAAGWLVVRSDEPLRAPLPARTMALTATVGRSVGASFSSGAAIGGGVTLGSGQELTVAPGGELLLQLGPGTTIGLHGPARVALAGTAAQVELRLGQGILDATVAHRQETETFAVVTDDARVAVRGTRFTVGAVQPAPWVRVDEGRVMVRTRDGRERSVTAGESLALRAPAANMNMNMGAAPSSVPAASIDTAPPAGCMSVARRARLAMRARAYDRALAILLNKDSSRDATEGARASPPSPCQDELRYLKAEALRLDGQLAAAAAAYKKLDRREAPAVTRQNALYAAAELEQRLGQAAAARADYERAFTAAPAGALSAESLAGAMEAAWRQGDGDAARGLAARYLERFPEGAGAKLAHRIQSAAIPKDVGRGE